MDNPGPSNLSVESTNSQRIPGVSPASPFGFPEKDVINFINSFGLSSSVARDFMLFLTFSNQIIRYTNGRSVSLACATAVANVVYQLSEGENTPGATDVAAISKIFQSESSFSPSSSVKTIRKSPVNKELKGVRPIFAKHNDAKFYPNIMCVICKEWVCSRSRRIHISAHFGYRKYTCSTCDFSHTKEIFVETHIRKCHNRVGSVLQKDDPAVESRIEDACNDSIAMTRDVLRGQYDDEIYASYANMSTDRSQIANKERRSRTQVLSVVSDGSNAQLLQ
ncbi:hypothetical protein RB195_019711 [Necator americanus]|uniref:C2H2-type domain-containing protein n=1 Tax=Necator americanus TaxID=51031 RepID=A0ABR1CH21_NECAM